MHPDAVSRSKHVLLSVTTGLHLRSGRGHPRRVFWSLYQFVLFLCVL